MYDIITCGSNSVDAFVETDTQLTSIKGEEGAFIAYPLGSKLLMKHLEFVVGGGGTNVLETFVKQGFSCAYLGKIGCDVNGNKVFSWLKEKNVDFVGQAGGDNGFAVVLDLKGKDRTILLHKGSNNSLSDDLAYHKLKTKWFYSSAMMDESHETLKKVFRYMKNHGTKCVYNLNNIVAQKGLGHIKDLLSCCEVFILNKEEAELLVGSGSLEELGARLSVYGPRVVAITDGAAGVSVYSDQGFFTVHPRPDHKVVETTGAGDAFGSGLVSGLMHGLTLKESVLCGIRNAESVIAFVGAKRGALDKKTLLAAIKK